MLGCYRKTDCDDPEIFATAAIAVLSRYPEDVVRQVTDPHSGLPATSKWVPRIAELREACETVNNAARRRAEADGRIAAQFAERDRLEALEPAEKRREFIKREMEKISAFFAKAEGDGAERTYDVRGMDDGPAKDIARSKLAAELAAKAKAYTSTPCAPLSISSEAGSP